MYLLLLFLTAETNLKKLYFGQKKTDNPERVQNPGPETQWATKVRAIRRFFNQAYSCSYTKSKYHQNCNSNSKVSTILISYNYNREY